MGGTEHSSRMADSAWPSLSAAPSSCCTARISTVFWPWTSGSAPAHLCQALTEPAAAFLYDMHGVLVERILSQSTCQTQTDRVDLALQPTWLIGLGRAQTWDLQGQKATQTGSTCPPSRFFQ